MGKKTIKYLFTLPAVFLMAVFLFSGCEEGNNQDQAKIMELEQKVENLEAQKIQNSEEVQNIEESQPIENAKPLNPSERALRVASRLFLNPNIREDLLERYGGENKDSRLAIRNFAFYLDDNLEMLIASEEIVGNNSNTASGSPVQEYSGNTGVSEMDEYKQRQQEKCQKDLNKYNVCMNEYNAKMADYNSCLAENADPNKRFKSYCFKPTEFCFKPICAY